MRPLFSIVINSDTRHGYRNSQSAIGDFGEGSLQGVRSADFLIEGVKNKMKYFRGYDRQCILYVDKHEDIPDDLYQEMKMLVESYGNNSKLVIKSHNRTKDRWYDLITLEALKLAIGSYIVHLDQDSNAFRTDDCDIIDRYITWLESEYKYVCQPWNGVGDPMIHASTRFFICKRETLDFELIEKSLVNPLLGKHNPCLEFTLGILAGDGKVLYPPREDDKYIVFSWAKYFSGTLERLNKLPYSKIKLYIDSCGIHGANDLIDVK